LNITKLTLANAAYYQVVVTNTAGSTTSRVAPLVVNSSTPLYTWSPPVPITTMDAKLTQPGSVVGAAVFAGTEQLVVLANGTNINFKADGSVAPVTGAGTATSAYLSATTGSPNFDALLMQFSWDGGPKTITLKNLTAGQHYSVQLFALDDRSDVPVLLGFNSAGEYLRLANFQIPVSD
jgi:hypothetical protein